MNEDERQPICRSNMCELPTAAWGTFCPACEKAEAERYPEREKPMNFEDSSIGPQIKK
jgi:hypothetical protein